MNGSWTFGVSADPILFPKGFVQTTALYSSAGPTAAWDGFGTLLRSHGVSKAVSASNVEAASSDLFINSVTLFTDNGAGIYGNLWETNPNTSHPPPYRAPTAAARAQNATYDAMNWSSLSEATLVATARNVKEVSGVAVRGVQMDDWPYPFRRGIVCFREFKNGTGRVTHCLDKPNNNFAMLCGNDWRPPAPFFTNSSYRSLRAQVGELMLYLPAVCAPGGLWKDRFRWDDTGEAPGEPGQQQSGWLLPIAEDAQSFFNELFDYGQQLSAPPEPGALSEASAPWMPIATRVGRAAMGLAVYETDSRMLNTGDP